MLKRRYEERGGESVKRNYSLIVCNGVFERGRERERKREREREKGERERCGKDGINSQNVKVRTHIERKRVKERKKERNINIA